MQFSVIFCIKLNKILHVYFYLFCNQGSQINQCVINLAPYTCNLAMKACATRQGKHGPQWPSETHSGLMI